MRMTRAAYGRVFGLLLLAGAAGSSAKAQGANKVQIQDWILNEPAGGVDYNKLPDVEGIHLGMPVPESVAIVRKLYSSGKVPPDVYWVKFANSTDKPWISYMRGSSPGPDGQTADTILVRFSAPPSPQRVVWIQRQVNFQNGKAPNGAVVLKSLREKYGMNTKGALGPTGVAWVMDEQAKPVPAAFGNACTGTLQSSVNGSQQSPGTLPFLLSPNPFSDYDLTRLSRMCKYPINITTLLDEKQAEMALGSLTVTMTENAIDTRAAIATQKYIDKLNAAQKQRQINQGNQQAPPKL